MSKAVPLPGITFAGASYPLDEAVFKPLPRNDARRIRHNEVERFRRAPRSPERPRWNPSVLDEAHPFPERPIMHSLKRYEGVEVVHGVFPDSIRGTAHLRTGCRSPQWTLNASRAKGRNSPPSSGHTSTAIGGFLERLIIENNLDEKKKLRRGWCASTLASNPAKDIGNLEELRKSYVNLNKTKKHLLKDGAYISPLDRVKSMSETIRVRKRDARTRDEQGTQPQGNHSNRPAVFKMSNIDEWWHLDPTLMLSQAAEEERKDSTEDVNNDEQN